MRLRSLVARAKKALSNALLAVQTPFCEEVLVLGDSHAAVFGHPLLRLKFWRYRLRVVSVRGATASGLENPNSASQAFQIFEQALTATRASKVVVLLGEVDAGFVIWYRAARDGVPVWAAFEQTLATYGQFLRELQVRGFDPICVSAPLPTIGDDNDWGEVANLRRSVTASQLERTELTLSLNQQLADFCRTQGVSYLDLDADSLGPDGLVAAALLSRNRLDHHYRQRAYAALLAQPLQRALRHLNRDNLETSNETYSDTVGDTVTDTVPTRPIFRLPAPVRKRYGSKKRGDLRRPPRPQPAEPPRAKSDAR